MPENIQIDSSWKELFLQEQNKPYFSKLMSEVKTEYQSSKCFPDWANIFQVFALSKLSDVKVVIIGQDPYHQPHQAHGLAFSVQPNISLPPSLRNIYQELKDDLKIDNGNNGYLVEWATQGVLLLNTTLTVRMNQANSHSQLEWATFTDNVLKYLNSKKPHLVFILWGQNAINKMALVDQSKHLVITSPHPSPLSANRGFFGSKPFSKTNEWLEQKGITPIDWKLKSRNSGNHF